MTKKTIRARLSRYRLGGGVLSALLLVISAAGLAEDKPAVSTAPLSGSAYFLKSVTLPEPEADDPSLAPRFDPRLEARYRQQEPDLAARARMVMGWVDQAAEGEVYETPTGRCQPDQLGRPGALCGMRWRKNDAFSDFRARYDRMTGGVKAGLLGESLAEHMEFDLDTSPEIKFTYEFD